MKYYKILDELGRSTFHISPTPMQYSLPAGNKPGKWMKPLSPRKSPGYTGNYLWACRSKDLAYWIQSRSYLRIFEVELKNPRVVENSNKVSCTRMRLLREVENPWKKRNIKRNLTYLQYMLLLRLKNLQEIEEQIEDLEETIRLTKLKLAECKGPKLDAIRLR